MLPLFPELIGVVSLRDRKRAVMKEQIEKIVSSVPEIVQNFESSEVAQHAQRAAEIALLTRILEIVRPAVRALGTRPTVRYQLTNHGDVNYGGGIVRIDEPHRERVLPLNCNRIAPSEDAPRANSGSYEGVDYGLEADGTIVKFVWSGSWSRWQGSTDEFEAEIFYTDVPKLLENESLNSIIEHIEHAVSKAGNRENATKKAIERADKIAAILELVK